MSNNNNNLIAIASGEDTTIYKLVEVSKYSWLSESDASKVALALNDKSNQAALQDAAYGDGEVFDELMDKIGV